MPSVRCRAIRAHSPCYSCVSAYCCLLFILLQDADHNLPRQLLQHVVCNTCQHSQPLAEGNTCRTCGTRFADYFCRDCGTANNDVPAAGYFHCDACGICRVGTRQEFFHCTGCGCCLRRALQGVSACPLQISQADRPAAGKAHAACSRPGVCSCEQLHSVRATQCHLLTKHAACGSICSACAATAI
jgi:hypothetical protein